MAEFFSTLGFDFDVTKFGDTIDPYNDVEQRLLKQRPILNKWQTEALANNDVDGYLQNPVLSISLDLYNSANNLKNIVSGIDVFDDSGSSAIAFNIANTANNIMNEVISFNEHTNNISGVTETEDYFLPSLDTALGVGDMVLQLTHKTDKIANNMPILGSFTSLFIENDIEEYFTILTTDASSVNNSITITESVDGNGNTIITQTSSISFSVFSLIWNHANSAYSLLNTRRTHDINYYGNCLSLVDKINKLTKFSQFAPLKLYLVDKYIGTDKLKNNL